MLSNYLKIAWRLILRNKVYTAINLLGLAIGIACTVLISLYVLDELSYDRFHEKADRIVRVVENQSDQEGNVAEMATTFGALAPVLETEFPEWESVSRLFRISPLVSVNEEKKFQEKSFFFADSTALEVFDFEMRAGDRATALDAPFSLVITETAAKRYFGEENPMGQVLTVRDDEGENDFKITGVLKDIPGNSHIYFEFLASYATLKTTMPWVNNWHYPPMYTYALLPPNYPPTQAEERLAAFPKKHMRADLAESRSYELQPLTSIHLNSQREGEISANGDMTYIYVFAAIGFFILLIACINFMNLATARSINRAKEVGMRKAMGAHRGQLVKQFLSESFLMVLLAMGLALGVIALVLPGFNELAGKALEISYFSSWQVPVIGLGILLFVGLLAGSYPAFFLSGFRPVEVLKGLAGFQKGGAAWLRKGLVIFQFAISCALIVGTTVIYSQMDFIRNKRLGFEKQHLVIIPLRDEKDQTNAESLRRELTQSPHILSAAACSGLPAKGGYYGFPITPKNARLDSLSMATNFLSDHDYVKTMGMEIIAGRDFSEDFSTDASEAFLINEAAAKKLGWDDPINQELTTVYHYKGRVVKTGKVIGVVKDFHQHSLHKEVDPVIMHISGATYYTNSIAVRISGQNVSDALSFMQDKWQSFNPIRPFEYSFMDEVIDTMYKKEENLGQVAGMFALLTVFIACLGLFGLAAFTTEQRLREIGIRKVLGASTGSIIRLLTSDFLKLVMVAFVLGIPLAYFMMDSWLSGFAYHVQIGVGIFVVAGAISLLIAFLTVSTQALKAARTNPADTLRSE